MELRRTTASEELFGVLRDAILAGRYAPGEKLPSQRTLAGEYSLNATTVREAIKRLEQLRLVEVRHGDAMRVLDWRTHGGLDVLASAVLASGTFDVAVLRAVLEARRLLLVEAGRLAADRRSEASALRLHELADELARTADDEAAQAIDFAFWTEVVEAAGNLVFLLITNSIRDVYFRHAALFRAVAEERAAVAPLFARVADAVAAGDTDAAAAAVGALTRNQENRLLERLA
jgi:GntR family transcriptional regulator, transcriptional repressor for pyruvate dehydrogenase complex